MAGDKINKDDIVGGLITGLQKVREELALTLSEVAEFTKNQKAFAETINLSSSKSLKDLASTLEILSKNVKVHNTILNNQYKLEKRLMELEVMKVAQIKALNDAEVKKQVRKQQYLKTAKDEAEVTLLNNKIKREEAKEKERLAKIDAKLANEAKKLSGEYAKQSAHLNKIRAEYKDLNTKKQLNQVLTKDEIIKLGQLEKEFRNLDKILKKVDADAGQFQRNVGNYTESIKDAINETNLFGDSLDKLGNSGNIIIASLGKIIVSLKNIQKAEEGAETGANKLGKTLKAIGIGAIIAALTSLYATFTSTREGGLKFELLVSKLSTRLDALFSSLANAGRGILGIGKALKLAAKLDFKEASAALDEAINQILKSFDDYGAKVDKNLESNAKLIKLQFDWEDQLRKLNRQLQQTTLDLDDQREIANDYTISFEQRNKAIEASFILEKKAAQIRQTIAKQELKFINDKLRIELTNAGITRNLSDEELKNIISNNELRLKVGENTLKQQQEAILALEESVDVVSDLERQQNERRRQILEKQLSLDIELLRSKKNSTKLLSEELQKQIDNERNALDERESFAKEQIDNEREITDLIIKRIKDTAKAEIQLNTELTKKEKEEATAKIDALKAEELLRQGNAILLEEEIKNAGLSVQLTTDLASAIKKAQDAELKGEENLKKIEEERIALKNRLLELEAERQRTVQEGVIADLKAMEEDNIKRQEKIQEDLLKNENAFNKDLINERKSLHEQTMAFIEAEFIERKKLLKLQFDADIQAVDHSTLKEEEKDAKKLIIQEKYNQEVKELDRQKTNALTEEQKREVEALKETQKAQLQILTETAQLITSELERAYNDAADKRQEDLDKSIDKRKENIDKQKELAEKGADTQLAFEEAQLAKEELLKAEQQRKDELNKKIIAYWNMLASYAESNPDTALQKTLKNIAIAEGATALFKKLPSAYEGTEDTGASGDVDNKGGKLWVLHPHERVVTAEQNNLIGDLTNKDLAKLAYDFRTGVLHSEVGQESFGQNLSTSIDMMKYANMIDKKLDKFVQAVQNIEPTHVHLDNLGQVITEKVRNGILKREININTKSLR